MVEDTEDGQKPATGAPRDVTDLFPGQVIELGMEPIHFGILERPDGHAKVTGECGDTDEVFLHIRQSRVREVRFRTNGCIYSIAACEAMAQLAEGRAVRECIRVNEVAILEYLGGLPESHEHCARLAAHTLYQAVRHYAVWGKGVAY